MEITSGWSKTMKPQYVRILKTSSSRIASGQERRLLRWISAEQAPSRKGMDAWTNDRSLEVACLPTPVTGRDSIKSSNSNVRAPTHWENRNTGTLWDDQ